jgi:hypothetical protein
MRLFVVVNTGHIVLALAVKEMGCALLVLVP